MQRSLQGDTSHVLSIRCTIAQMNSREAEDFLVQQTAEQAMIEHLPFSELERRMIDFTESGGCPEDPIALNDAFEAQIRHGAVQNEDRKVDAPRLLAPEKG